MPQLPPIAGKTLALAILLLVVAGLYLIIVQPLTAMLIGGEASIADLRDALARYSRVAAELEPLQAQQAAIGKDSREDAMLLHGANETLMAAEIQNKLKELVASAQGELSSSQIMPSEADGNLRRIAVRGQVAISLDGAQRVFRDLEQEQPLLFLDNVDIRSDEGSRRRRQRGVAPGMLQIRLDVYGFARPPAPSQAKPGSPAPAVKPR
jgi:general secretion pathway protein M